MHRPRLENALRVLRTVRDESFSIAHWRLDIEKPDAVEQEHREQPSCGFVACAVGHMAMDPWFNDQGLTLEKLNNGYSVKIIGFPDHQLYDSFEALGVFFDLPLANVRRLFSGITYALRNPPVSAVIGRIEELLEKEAQDAP